MATFERTLMRDYLDIMEGIALPWGHGTAGCWITDEGNVLPCDYEADEHHADIAFQYLDFPDDQDPDEMPEINAVAFAHGWIRIRMTAMQFIVQCSPDKINTRSVNMIPKLVDSDGHEEFVLEGEQYRAFPSIGRLMNALRVEAGQIIAESYVTTLSTTAPGQSRKIGCDIFVNPSPSEIKELKNIHDTIKAIITSDETVYAWAHHLFHHGDVERDLGIDDAGAARLTFGYDSVMFYSRKHDRRHNAALADIITSSRFVRQVTQGHPNVIGPDGGFLGMEEDALVEKVRDNLGSAYSTFKAPLYENPSATEFRVLMAKLKLDTDPITERTIAGTMRGTLDPETGDVMIWDGFYAPHGYVKDRYGIDTAFHLILTPEAVTVLTLWRYERQGQTRETVEEMVKNNPHLARMYRGPFQTVIQS